MAENTINTRIQHKIDTTANWTNSSLVLKNGELGIERTANNVIKIKIGNGTDIWGNLPYVVAGDQGLDDEIYIGNTEPIGYRIWINPSGMTNNATDSSPIYYIDFSITQSNNTETISTNDSYSNILTEYQLGTTIIARINMGSETLFAPLLIKGNTNTNPNHIIFYFGVPVNNQFKIISLDDTDTCSISQMSLGSNGTSFSVGKNMKLENNILSAKYGDLVSQYGEIIVIDPNSLPENINYMEDPIFIEEVNQIMIILLDYTKGQLIPPISSGNVYLIGNYQDETNKIINSYGSSTEETNNEEGLIQDVSTDFNFNTPVYYTGSENALSYFIALTQEQESSQETIAAWQLEENINKLSYLFVNDESISNQFSIVMLCFPASMMKSNNNADIVSFTLKGNINTTYKIPSSAINIGNNLTVNNYNAIEVKKIPYLPQLSPSATTEDIIEAYNDLRKALEEYNFMEEKEA